MEPPHNKSLEPISRLLMAVCYGAERLVRNARSPSPDLMVCDNAEGAESDLCKGRAAVPLSCIESRVWEAARFHSGSYWCFLKGQHPPPQTLHSPKDLPQRNGQGDRCKGA